MAKHSREALGRRETPRDQRTVLVVAKAGSESSSHKEAPSAAGVSESGLAVAESARGEAFDDDFASESDEFAFAHDGELWPEIDVVPDDAAFARHYSDRDAPKRRKRRRFTLRGFARGLGKVLLFLFVSALAATIVGAIVYMVGTHTPIAEMPHELVVFFGHLFA